MLIACLHYTIEVMSLMHQIFARCISFRYCRHRSTFHRHRRKVVTANVRTMLTQVTNKGPVRTVHLLTI